MAVTTLTSQETPPGARTALSARSRAGPHANKAVRAPRVSQCDEWRLLEYDVVDSTNLAAAGLPAGTAVRADTQTAGRGRFQRSWVSDAGGLWLSAVVPTGLNGEAARVLPLVTGMAVIEALQESGVRELRMRWPNDVLVDNHSARDSVVGQCFQPVHVTADRQDACPTIQAVRSRKLAGLLIDQFKPGLAVAGIGINVRNQPEARDGSLKNQTVRLADLLNDAPELSELTRRILRALRVVVNVLNEHGFAKLLPRVNLLWGGPREVRLDLDGPIRRGKFIGVDERGRLRLEGGCGETAFYESHQVKLLREI